jgi:hypothetical protein
MPFELRHFLEIHAVIEAMTVGGVKDDGEHRKELDYVVLRKIYQAKRRIEQELDLLRFEAGVLLKRLQVA